MTSMAKIFVVVNLVLAIATFGSAAVLLGAQDDYRKALREASETFDAYKSTQEKRIAASDQQLRNQLDTARQLSDAKSAAESENETLKTQLAAAKAKNEKAIQTIATYSSTIERLSKNLEEQKGFVETLSAEAKAATADKLNYLKKWEDEVANRQRLEVAVANLNEQVASQQAKVGDLEKANREYTTILGEIKKNNPSLVPMGSMGKPGRVNQVKGNLVGISVGSADGVRVGDVYQIRRGSAYVGQIKITSVARATAVGVFDTEFVGSGKAPEIGDVATPDINAE